MKKVILFLSFLVIANVVNAESWLIVNKQTQEILSLSNEDDAQIPDSNYEKIIILEDLKDIELQYHPTNYKYKNDKFIVNIQKISDEALAQEEAEEINQEEKEVIEWLRDYGITELRKGGKVFNKIKKSDE